jgi:hypothetical protein
MPLMPRDRVVFRFSKTRLAGLTLIEVILLVGFVHLVLQPSASTRYSSGFIQFVGLWGMLAMGIVTALGIVRLSTQGRAWSSTGRESMTAQALPGSDESIGRMFGA